MINDVSITENDVRVQVVADMKLFMKHVMRATDSECAWDYDTRK